MNSTMGCAQLMFVLVLSFTWFSTSECVVANFGFPTKSTTPYFVSFVILMVRYLLYNV